VNHPREALACCERGDEAFRRTDFAAAAGAFREALALSRPFPEAANNLGNALMMTGAYQEALEAYLEADCPDAWVNASVAARILGSMDLARELLGRALEAQPDNPIAQLNLGNLLKDLGRVDLALACYDAARSLNPADPVPHGNLAYLCAFDPAYDAQEILALNREWDHCHARGLAGPAITPDPGKRLRIGYVSPDFRYHCQAFFTLPLFAHHDREAFEVFAYASVATPDAVTERLQTHCDHWRNCAGLSDDAVAEQVRRDGIDILVDLTMHMANGRPLLFARKPAPVQVAWLAYPGTTGLSAMDYRITDPYLDPPGLHEDWYAERSLRLPHTFWCYTPLAEEPDPGPLPAQARGSITFGCLNNFCKVNPGVLALWNRVLEAVPGSRLRLMAQPGSHRQAVLEAFSDPGRIEFTPFLPRQDYLAQYRDIDLCLDTFPYNGHTTSLDAFWMGVPTVTLVGETVVGRAGWSQLNNLGLTELAAWSADDFVAIAAGLASDLPKLAGLRAGLRARMEASPLMDAPRFARDMEALYRRMAGRLET
jgi:predicted O-linked N-acetylglucosamine transferase (SPINDLY family)